MNRHNFYVDPERMTRLRQLAEAEGNVTISELVREGIDMIIIDRLNNPRISAHERRAKFDALISQYYGKQPGRNRAEDEALIQKISAERKASRRKKHEITL